MIPKLGKNEIINNEGKEMAILQHSKYTKLIPIQTESFQMRQ